MVSSGPAFSVDQRTNVSEDELNALRNTDRFLKIEFCLSLIALTRSVLPIGKMPCFLNLSDRQIDGETKLLIPGIRSR